MSSLFSVLGLVTGLYALFLLALVVTSHHDRRTTQTAFTSPPTNVHLLVDERDDLRVVEMQRTPLHTGSEAA
jgi:hypothetical protein